MQGGGGADDQEKRTPMRWNGAKPTYGFTTASSTWDGLPEESAGVDVETQRAAPQSLWQRYRKSISVRHSNPALSLGSTSRPRVQAANNGVMALLRSKDSSRVLFVANFGATASGAFTVTSTGSPVVLDQEGLAGDPTSDGAGDRRPTRGATAATKRSGSSREIDNARHHTRVPGTSRALKGTANVRRTTFAASPISPTPPLRLTRQPMLYCHHSSGTCSTVRMSLNAMRS